MISTLNPSQRAAAIRRLVCYDVRPRDCMDLDELKRRLEEEGCSPAGYAIESRGSDVFCLLHDGAKWVVFYTERGSDSDPIYTSESEEEACEFFFRHICAQPNWHLVGVFPSELEASAFETEVRRMGATPIRNDLPECMTGAPQFRVFVAGRDIHAVKAIKQ